MLGSLILVGGSLGDLFGVRRVFTIGVAGFGAVSVVCAVAQFHTGMGISAALVAAAGLLGLAGIRDPRRVVRCEGCAGGQLAGAPQDVAPAVAQTAAA